MSRRRLDVLLTDRGLFESRSRAAAAVIAGDVLIGAGRERAVKPGQLVPPDAEIAVDERPQYASRGGIKLANALQTTEIEVAGRRCLDIGAATGGFTDCLLQAGAEAVIALDVAYGELRWELREDPRVVVMERKNARELLREDLPWAPDLIVADVSFISLQKVLEPVLATAAPEFDCLAMVKPQFEVGRDKVGKGGVVRSPADRREAILGVAAFARDELGVAVRGFAASGLPGPAGNRETFVWLARSGGVEDLDAAARTVVP